MKYNINKEYKVFSKVHSPIYKPIIPIANSFLGLVKTSVKSDKEIIVTKRYVQNENINVPIVIMEPKNKENKACIIYFHGGGFILKAYGKHFALMKKYALLTSSTVIFVDYRLAPKHPFPNGLLDCFSVYKWVMHSKLNIDKSKIVLCGDSAGGNFCLGVSLLAFDENEKNSNFFKPCLEVLAYPVVDYRMETESMKKYTNTPFWNSKLNVKMWKWYLKNANEELLKYVSPVRDEDIVKLPPTYLETAEYDCLHDEGYILANKMKNLGLTIELVETIGTIHGYEILLNSETMKDCMKKRIKIMLDYIKD